MRLLSLELKDFQGHKSLKLDLDHPIVTLVGATDAGKSSVLRALRWVCLNDLAGDAFVREGTKKTEVNLTIKSVGEFSDVECTITRAKSIASTGINIYQLDARDYKAFGQSVPDDIAQLLDLNEINFQAQHDSPFWFAETAGEVSRRLNAVVDLSVIDSALAYIAAQVRQAQERNTLIEERLTEAKGEMAALDLQRPRVQEFQEIKQQDERINLLKRRRDKLESVISQIRLHRDCRKDFEEKATDGGAVLELARTARNLTKQWTGLRDILEEIEEQKDKAQPPPDFVVVESAYGAWSEIRQRLDGLSRIMGMIETARTRAFQAAAKAGGAEGEFHNRTKGQDCPTCKRPL